MDADPDWRRISGNIVFPGFTAPKVHWVRRHEPETRRPHRQGPAAQGLPAPLADGRPCRRDVGRVPAPHGSTPARATGRTRCWRRAAFRATRCRPSSRARPSSGEIRDVLRLALGPSARNGRRGRRRRQRGLGHRRGCRRRRHRVPVARHLGRALRRERRLPARPRAARCTRSATPCPAPGTRWASSSPRPTR